MFGPATGSSSWLALNSGVQGPVPVSLALRHRLTSTISSRPQHLCTTAAVVVGAAFCCRPAAQACSCRNSANTSRSRTRPAADAHRVRRMFTSWPAAAAFGSVQDDGETLARAEGYGVRNNIMSVSGNGRRDGTRARVIVSPCATVVVRVRARARAAPGRDESGFVIP